MRRSFPKPIYFLRLLCQLNVLETYRNFYVFRISVQSVWNNFEIIVFLCVFISFVILKWTSSGKSSKKRKNHKKERKLKSKWFTSENMARLLSLLSLMAVGIVLTSFLNLPHYLMFLGSMTLWAFKRKLNE